ncbi:hypothetical protein H0H87_002428, partial [Tephrocybe sp. NHM501043]
QMEIKRGKGQATSPPNEPSGDERLAEIKRNEVVKRIDDAAWVVLHAKLESTGQHQPQKSPERCIRIDINSDNEQEDHGLVPSFSKAVLALAPHLGNLSLSSIISDPIFEKSHRLKAAYTSKKSINLLIDRAQLKWLVDPISQSAWKKIILDRPVDFEHLYATFKKGYNHINESKDFNEEFTIIKKDSLRRKRASSQNLTGIVFLTLGELQFWFSIIIGRMNSLFTGSMWSRFSTLHLCYLPLFCSIMKLEKRMLKDLLEWMISTSYHSRCLDSYSLGILKCLNVLQVDLLQLHKNVQLLFVRTGILDIPAVRVIHVTTTGSTTFAASAMALTEQKTTQHASQASKESAVNSEQLASASLKAAKAKFEGPYPLLNCKRKAVNLLDYKNP